MKRANVFSNGSRKNGMLVEVDDNLCDFLLRLSEKFSRDITTLFSASGGLIDNTCIIRDDDELYASSGEDFIPIVKEDNPEPSLLTKGDNLDTIMMRESDWVRINVGGKVFATTRCTLTTREPESMLARMFSTLEGVTWSSRVDDTGAYLIDRSHHYFEPILNYLRHGQVIIDKDINIDGVIAEAQFYGLQTLTEKLEEMSQAFCSNIEDKPVSRRELTLRLLSVATNTELRCQGLDFTNADLSHLDLRCINFKYAIMKNTNLAGANLAHCNLERAIMHHATLDGANLLGVKMLCVNLESASLKGCNFEDPAGSRANLEGAQMKFVNLEGSHMAGVNLRVATLKNTNLKNCDLRGAVLAGTDLENCNLSGCDLQDANLRGANLKGASFELLHALHMSQTV